jgi:hypothetical protein
LCALAIGVIALPGDMPGLVIPGGAHGMERSMSMMR